MLLLRLRELARVAWLRAAAPHHAPHLAVRWLVLRLFGVVLLIAAVSLWTQVIALSGADGIVPMAGVLEAQSRQFGPLERLWLTPTLCWLWDSDAMLHLLCAATTVSALLLIANLAPRAALIAATVSYLSLAAVCDPWLGFQWDALLVESCLLGALYAPRGLRPGLGAASPPAPAALFLLRFLVFRLHLESGIVKLTSGDPAWRDLSALDYHYETQPLPSFTSAWAHALPPWLLAVSCAGMFAVEIGAPLLLFGWRPLRLAAAAALVLLQLGILGTGNYAFFNLLTITLVLTCLDDRALEPVLRRLRRAALPVETTSAAPPAPSPSPSPRPRARGTALAVFTTLSLVIAAAQIANALFPRRLPRQLRRGLAYAAAPMLLNSYGLFRWMTRERDEIILSGSDDGEHWLDYELPHKPGNPRRAPQFVAPHQPRLDWQLWFAALSDCRDPRNGWFIALLERILQQRSRVLALFGDVPFPRRPPRYLRSQLWRYHLTSPAERRRTGAWWRRELLGAYCPVVTLVNGRIAALH